jgi:hypothetical protein
VGPAGIDDTETDVDLLVDRLTATLDEIAVELQAA